MASDMNNEVKYMNNGENINLMLKGIHTKDEVMSLAVSQNVIDADDYFSGDAESGWWKAVPRRDEGIEYHKSSEGVRGAFSGHLCREMVLI